jgi:hypothetical protein
MRARYRVGNPLRWADVKEGLWLAWRAGLCPCATNNTQSGGLASWRAVNRIQALQTVADEALNFAICG